MQFPSDYLVVIADGVRVLRAVAARLRDSAARNPNDPQLWLSVRDCEGLADRLSATRDQDWRQGFSHLMITGQDIGVLDALLSGHVVESLANEEATTLARLRGFLQQYKDGAFALDESL